MLLKEMGLIDVNSTLGEILARGNYKRLDGSGNKFNSKSNNGILVRIVSRCVRLPLLLLCAGVDYRGYISLVPACPRLL